MVKKKIVRVTEEIHKILRKFALEKDTTLQKLVEEIISLWIKKHD